MDEHYFFLGKAYNPTYKLREMSKIVIVSLISCWVVPQEIQFLSVNCIDLNWVLIEFFVEIGIEESPKIRNYAFG